MLEDPFLSSAGREIALLGASLLALWRDPFPEAGGFRRQADALGDLRRICCSGLVVKPACSFLYVHLVEEVLRTIHAGKHTRDVHKFA